MRVLIVVDNALTAEAIRREMRHMPACQVIGYVNGRVSCAMTVAEAEPDLVLIDDMSERQATLSRIREVRAAVPAAKIVLLTVRMDGDWLAETTSAGVHAAISKSAPPSSVGLLVRAVATGNVYHAFDREPTRASRARHAARPHGTRVRDPALGRRRRLEQRDCP